jgi:hypothetical protein
METVNRYCARVWQLDTRSWVSGGNTDHSDPHDILCSYVHVSGRTHTGSAFFRTRPQEDSTHYPGPTAPGRLVNSQACLTLAGGSLRPSSSHNQAPDDSESWPWVIWEGTSSPKAQVRARMALQGGIEILCRVSLQLCCRQSIYLFFLLPDSSSSTTGTCWHPG